MAQRALSRQPKLITPSLYPIVLFSSCTSRCDLEASSLFLTDDTSSTEEMRQTGSQTQTAENMVHLQNKTPGYASSPPSDIITSNLRSEVSLDLTIDDSLSVGHATWEKTDQTCHNRDVTKSPVANRRKTPYTCSSTVFNSDCFSHKGFSK